MSDETVARRHVVVSEWNDIDSAPSVSDRDKQRVATIITEQEWDHVVWIPDWLLEEDDKEIETVEASDHLAVGEIVDHSEKAWKLLQTHLHDATWGDFLPKSQVVVFERLRGVEEVETPQQGISSFGGDAGD